MMTDLQKKTLLDAAITFLDAHLDKAYSYHNAAHAIDVLHAVDEFSKTAALPEEVCELLQIAAIFHDFGYLQSPTDNERLVKEYLEQFSGYFNGNPEKIQKIADLIMETNFPYHPVTFEGKLLCDADLEYIGRDCFWNEATKFRQELRNFGKEFTDKEWLAFEIRFLEHIRFFTKPAIDSREAGRAQHCLELKHKLEQMQ